MRHSNARATGRMVSILTRPEGLMQCGGGRVGIRHCGFQSSPGQKAGCNDIRSGGVNHTLIVSILTRPEGRMQCKVTTVTVGLDDVSILTRPECRMQFCWDALVASWGRRFNPHPARRPDAIHAGNRDLRRGPGVSILTRPEGRMQSPQSKTD